MHLKHTSCRSHEASTCTTISRTHGASPRDKTCESPTRVTVKLLLFNASKIDSIKKAIFIVPAEVLESCVCHGGGGATIYIYILHLPNQRSTLSTLVERYNGLPSASAPRAPLPPPGFTPGVEEVFQEGSYQIACHRSLCSEPRYVEKRTHVAIS